MGSKEGSSTIKKLKIGSLFKSHRDTFTATIRKITKGRQLDRNNYNGHFDLYSEMLTAHTVVQKDGRGSDFDRRDVIREVLDSRLSHLSDRFWERDDKAQSQRGGHQLGFKDLLAEVRAWLRILDNKGMRNQQAQKSAKVNATNAQQPQAQQSTYANNMRSPPREQPTARCSLCESWHLTEKCNQMAQIGADERVKKLAAKNCCFHCLLPGHKVNTCPSPKPRCEICGEGHNTLLHGRTYPPRNQRRAPNGALNFRPRYFGYGEEQGNNGQVQGNSGNGQVEQAQGNGIVQNPTPAGDNNGAPVAPQA